MCPPYDTKSKMQNEEHPRRIALERWIGWDIQVETCSWYMPLCPWGSEQLKES